MQKLYRSIARRGRRRAKMKRADGEAIQTEGPQKEEKGDSNASGRSGYADQGPAEEGEGR